MHTGIGNTVIGPWPNGPATSEHQKIADVLSHITTTLVSPNMLGVKWSKLAINAAMTSCGAISGTTLGEMIRHAPSRQAFLAVVRETMAVMKAAGIRPERVGASKPDLLAKLPDWAARFVLASAAKRYGSSRSSSAQSILRGEPTEVDYLNGLIVEVGKQHEIPTPVNSAVVNAVHSLEQGKGTPGFAAVEQLMANANPSR